MYPFIRGILRLLKAQVPQGRSGGWLGMGLELVLVPSFPISAQFFPSGPLLLSPGIAMVSMATPAPSGLDSLRILSHSVPTMILLLC